jgi:hypothetical protein
VYDDQDAGAGLIRFHKFFDTAFDFEALKTKFYKYFHMLSRYIRNHESHPSSVKEIAHI